MTTPPTIYDLVPYESLPIATTAPEHLVLASMLEGGPRPPLDRFRMLEIGCGDGSNLLPLAFYHPDATFVGIDASRVQIEAGRDAAAAVGVRNLRLETADLRAPGDLGAPFDYVVSHGVFSWVPEDARHAILACCRDRLAPEGLAYVSYNVYPGWKARGTVREVLLDAVRSVAEPRARANRAKEVAAALRAVLDGRQSKRPYHALLAEELGFVVESTPSYVLHEYLSEENVAFYLRDFVALAEGHGLDYVTDALLRAPAEEVPEGLRDQPFAKGLSALEVQQAVDVLRNRQFRAAVLCRSGTARRPPAAHDALAGLRVASHLTSVSGKIRLDPTVEETFEGEGDVEITARDPVLKAALWLLRELWPVGLALPDLAARAEALLREHGIQGAPSDAQRARLEKGMLMLYKKGLADLRPTDLPLGVPPGRRPALTRLARHELGQRPVLTSPAHVLMPLDDFEKRIAARLDGTRTLDELIAELVTGVASGAPPLTLGGAALTDPVVIGPIVARLAERAVAKLSGWGLLARAQADSSSISTMTPE